MATPFVGQIISVGFNFAPLNWFLCDGSLKPIDQYQVLFNLLGTMYGGDGVTTFGVPNLNGRVPLGAGQGPNLSPYVQGLPMGSESITLIGSNTAPHTHTINFSTATGTSTSPKGAGQLAVGVADAKTGLPGFYSDKAATVSLLTGTIQPAVGGQPHENRQSFLALNYIIAWAGVYPSQS